MIDSLIDSLISKAHQQYEKREEATLHRITADIAAGTDTVIRTESGLGVTSILVKVAEKLDLPIAFVLGSPFVEEPRELDRLLRNASAKLSDAGDAGSILVLDGFSGVHPQAQTMLIEAMDQHGLPSSVHRVWVLDEKDVEGWKSHPTFYPIIQSLSRK